MARSSEGVPHGYVDADERECVARPDAERHRLAAVEAQLRRVAPEALPFDVFGREAAEADPADLDAERHRLRHRVVNAAEHLVSGQPIVQLCLLAGRGGREVPADFQLVRKAGGGADGVGLGVPRPQVAIVQRSQAQAAPEPDVRRQAAPIRENRPGRSRRSSGTRCCRCGPRPVGSRRPAWRRWPRSRSPPVKSDRTRTPDGTTRLRPGAAGRTGSRLTVPARMPVAPS